MFRRSILPATCPLPAIPLTVTIVSVASDYNNDSYSDAALYSRSTASFTGTLTSGSPLLTDLSSLTGLVSGVTITGTGIPTGTAIAAVNTTSFTGTLATRLGVSYGPRRHERGFLPVKTLPARVSPPGRRSRLSTARLPLHCQRMRRLAGTQSLTTTTITLSANATVSGTQSLTASFGQWLVETTSVGPANPAPFWFTSGTAFGPSNVTPVPGRLRRRRLHRSGVLPVQHRDLVY